MIVSAIGGCLPGKQMMEFKSADTVLSESPSPDGKHVVTVFERDVGATADFSTIITIRRTSKKFDPEQGRIFVASGRHSVATTWLSGSNLTVSCNINQRDIFKKEDTAVDSITITYQK